MKNFVADSRKWPIKGQFLKCAAQGLNIKAERMRPFSPLLSYLISRKKADLPAYGPDGKTSGSGAHDASGAFLRGYGPWVRESHGISLMPLRRRSFRWPYLRQIHRLLCRRTSCRAFS